MKRRGATPWAVALGAIGWIVACASGAGDSTDGQTHWLGACRVDADCASPLRCECGLCTRGCNGHPECAELDGAAVCLKADVARADCAPSAGALGVCTASCMETTDCGTALSCNDGACVARGSAGAGGVAGLDESGPTFDGSVGGRPAGGTGGTGNTGIAGAGTGTGASSPGPTDGGPVLQSDASAAKCACPNDAGLLGPVIFDSPDCLCNNPDVVGQTLDCGSGPLPPLPGPCFAEGRVYTGCGLWAAWCYDPVGPSWTLAYDSVTGELAGVTVSNDVASGACGSAVYLWGRQDLSHWDPTCTDRTECPSGPEGFDCPTPAVGDGGATTRSGTPCTGVDDTTTCESPTAVCDAYPDRVGPCSDFNWPFCDCLFDECRCWALLDGIEPPYPDATATPCSSTEDLVTCAEPGAQCMSTRPDTSEPCAAFSEVVCDCDDFPCRCWATPSSRL